MKPALSLIALYLSFIGSCCFASKFRVEHVRKDNALESLFEIYRESIPEGPITSKTALERALVGKNVAVLVADGIRVGYVSYEIVKDAPEMLAGEESMIRIHHLIVRPEHRQNGYGYALISGVRSRLNKDYSRRNQHLRDRFGFMIDIKRSAREPLDFAQSVGFRIVKSQDVPEGYHRLRAGVFYLFDAYTPRRFRLPSQQPRRAFVDPVPSLGSSSRGRSQAEPPPPLITRAVQKTNNAIKQIEDGPVTAVSLAIGCAKVGGTIASWVAEAAYGVIDRDPWRP